MLGKLKVKTGSHCVMQRLNLNIHRCICRAMTVAAFAVSWPAKAGQKTMVVVVSLLLVILSAAVVEGVGSVVVVVASAVVVVHSDT